MNEKSYSDIFTINFYSEMKRQGYTNKRFSELSGLSESMVSRCSKQKRQLSLNSAGLIANTLMKSIDELAGHSQKKRATQSINTLIISSDIEVDNVILKIKAKEKLNKVIDIIVYSDFIDNGVIENILKLIEAVKEFRKELSK